MEENKTKEQLLDKLAEMRSKINELEHVQVKLRESELRCHRLLETANDAILIADAESGEILEANQRAGEMLGMPVREIVGMHQSQLHPEDEAERYRQIFRQHIQDGTAITEDVFVVNRNGFKIPVEISASVTEVKGRSVIQGIFRDITERKRAGEQIRHAKEYLDILFENTPEAIYLIDLKGKFLKINKAAEKISGYTRREAIGKSFQELNLIKANQIPRVISLLAQNALGKETGPEELTLNRKDGTQLEIEITAYPVHIDNRRLVLGIAHDITDRKRMAKQLKRSLSEKETLLQELYHRTKNNMQVISSLLNLQSAEIKDEASVRVLRETQDRIKSIALVHEKLYQTEDLHSLEIKDYIEALAESLLRSYRVGEETVSLKFDIENFMVSIDTAVTCGLIINELVSNALKYAFNSYDKGEIRISLHAGDGGEVELKVADNGPGLSGDFDFVKSGSLGLRLVSRLVRIDLKGNIELRTDNGTEFIITFSKSGLKNENKNLNS